MIKKAQLKDFDFIYQLYMNSKINPFLLYEVIDKNQFLPIFKELTSDNVLNIYTVDNKDIGMFKLIPLKHRNSHVAYLGGVAIDPTHTGKGYGKSMLEEIIELAQAQHFLRIELSVATHNHKAISLYEAVGFEKEGVLRKLTYLKSEDRYVDEVLMSYLF
jgi:putative acetyltransferase